MGLTSPEGKGSRREDSPEVKSEHFHCTVCQALGKQFTCSLSNLHTLTLLMPQNSIRKNHYYPHFTDEKNKAQGS